MKNRDYKNFAAGEYYHVFNRGNGKMDIFKDRADYEFFLERVGEYLFPNRRAPSASKRGLRKSFPNGAFTLVVYCLMPNHFHFLLRQNGDIPISKLMLSVCGGYSKFFNKKYNRVGSLFQDQFKAVRIETNEQLLWVSAYIHANPKVAGLASDLSRYRYSNYPKLLQSENSSLCDPKIILEQMQSTDSYREYVESSSDAIKLRKQNQLEIFLD